MRGKQFQFFPKIFPEFFYEYFTRRIEPPFSLSECHIWGGYGGRGGLIVGGTPHAKVGEVGIKVINMKSCHVNKFNNDV
jgi:hypothetical protein